MFYISLLHLNLKQLFKHVQKEVANFPTEPLTTEVSRGVRVLRGGGFKKLIASILWRINYKIEVGNARILTKEFKQFITPNIIPYNGDSRTTPKVNVKVILRT